ncbi:tRNA (mnm(5)s(2)U34)-methyltransferase [Anaerorhabdus sp.]|uniref:tRNA (mnm(5)s(2)U34)-methyltransferase n=1 Tax=Anaerorhabdus sp. TaxID=1872524 RepID=UPI002FC770B6
MENINTTCHRLLKEVLTTDMTAIDATCGNGNDTYFLCKHCHHVYAYDIQEAAIKNTQERCKDFSNLTLYHTSHEDIIKLNCTIDVVLFNFGYLPKSNSTIITQPTSSIKALDACDHLLKENGLMMLACYIGHPGGIEEHHAIHNWIVQHDYIVDTYQNNYENAPILYYCKKRKRT